MKAMRIGLGFSIGGDKWRPGWALGWLGCAGMGRPVFKEKKGFPSIGRVEIMRELRSSVLRGVGTAFVAEKKGGGKLHVVFFNVNWS